MWVLTSYVGYATTTVSISKRIKKKFKKSQKTIICFFLGSKIIKKDKRIAA
jgi:hypothetical protein